ATLLLGWREMSGLSEPPPSLYSCSRNATSHPQHTTLGCRRQDRPTLRGPVPRPPAPHLPTPHLPTPHLPTPHLPTPHLPTPHLPRPHRPTPHPPPPRPASSRPTPPVPTGCAEALTRMLGSTSSRIRPDYPCSRSCSRSPRPHSVISSCSPLSRHGSGSPRGSR